MNAPVYVRSGPVAEDLDRREHSMQALNAALRIADDEVRPVVECYCDIAVVDGTTWINTGDVLDATEDHDATARVARALQYIGLRSPDAFPWRFIRHPDRPELVRFEGKP